MIKPDEAKKIADKALTRMERVEKTKAIEKRNATVASARKQFENYKNRIYADIETAAKRGGKRTYYDFDTDDVSREIAYLIHQELESTGYKVYFDNRMVDYGDTEAPGVVYYLTANISWE